MFGQVNPTPYDLNFHCFEIPVRVTPWFWVMGILIAYPFLQIRRVDLIGIWILCLFFSLLIHGLGHAIAGRMIGWPSEVILDHFGSMTRYFNQYGYTTTRSVMVSLAGPGAGLLLFGLVLTVKHVLTQQDEHVNPSVLFALGHLEWINLYLGLLTLLPVLPLDGGRISQKLFHHFDPRLSLMWCHWISTMTAGMAAVLFLFLGYLFPTILLVLLTIHNFQEARRNTPKRDSLRKLSWAVLQRIFIKG